MKLFLSRSLLFLSLFTVSTLCAPSQENPSSVIAPLPLGEKLKLPGIHNAGKINDSLFRGAQPHPEGIEELKKLGVTTIVDLRGDNQDLIERERKQVESLGMRFVNIKVSGWSPPTNEQIAQFLSLFKDRHQKIFVHCRFGDDRTGVFVATYRMTREHWPSDQALKEMYFFGFNGFWHPAMKSYVRDFPEKLKTAPALSPFANKM
jgi:tyrosine-protein phosphatase SIW14